MRLSALKILHATGFALCLLLYSITAPALAGQATVLAGSFEFTVSGCRAVSTTLDCDIAVVNRTEDDRRILIMSRFRGGIRDMRLAALGTTTIIDDAGKEYEAEFAKLSNQNSQETGQTFFNVYSGTHPVLTLHFDNVGIRVSKISRLTLVVAEAGTAGLQRLNVVFHDLPVARQAADTGPQTKLLADRRFLIETPSWRIGLQGCRAVPDGIGCTMVATSLSDGRTALFVGWQGNPGAVRSLALERLGKTTMIDEGGAAFIATQMFVQKPKTAAREDVSNGQTSWLFEPYATWRFDLYFANTQNLTRIPRLDLALADQAMRGNQASAPPTAIAARFKEIPVASMPSRAEEAPVATEWVPAPLTDGEKIGLCSSPGVQNAMLQILRMAARNPKVQRLASVAKLTLAERADLGDLRISSATAATLPAAPPASTDFLCSVTYQSGQQAPMAALIMIWPGWILFVLSSVSAGSSQCPLAFPFKW